MKYKYGRKYSRKNIAEKNLTENKNIAEKI